MKRSKWSYPFYNILHPFAGVEEMHYYRRQSVLIAVIIFLFYMFSDVFDVWFLGAQFDIRDKESVNLLKTFLIKLTPLLLWSVSNWGFCILSDGKASFKEIFTVTLYALLPYTVSRYVYTVLSNFFLQEEGIFLKWIVVIGVGLSILLLATQLMNYQEYTLSKVIWSSFLTLLGMVLIVFVGFLLFALLQQIFTTVLTVYNEIVLRI